VFSGLTLENHSYRVNLFFNAYGTQGTLLVNCEYVAILCREGSKNKRGNIQLNT